MAVSDTTWSPSSWRELPAVQQPAWPDERAAEAAVAELLAMPPLVFAGEARSLKAALAAVCEGRAFLLQAGDCAESFRDFTAVSIREKLKILLQMSAVLTYGAAFPVVKVGRIAGQFAKPRSSPTENGLPSFFGHMVNGDEPTPEARTPDPDRMVRAYHQSAATLNLLPVLHRLGQLIGPCVAVGRISRHRLAADFLEAGRNIRPRRDCFKAISLHQSSSSSS